MKAYVMLSDHKLFGALDKWGQFSVVTPISKDQELTIPDEEAVLIVSEYVLDPKDLPALREGKQKMKIIYLIANKEDAFEIKMTQSICAAHNIEFVTPYHTVDQILHEIEVICFDVEKQMSKVITGISALPQMGLTSSLLWIGYQLAKMYDIRVGIFGMNGWNPGDTFLQYRGKYLDEIWGEVNSKKLQIDELKVKMHELQPNLFYLAGNRDMKKLYYYQTDGVSWLIKEAIKGFDLVILDVGAYFDHALAAQSIYASDLTLLHMTQGEDARNAWNRSLEFVLKPVLGYKKDTTIMVFNKMLPSKRSELFSAKELSQQLGGYPFFGSLPYVSTFYRTQIERNLFNLQHEEYIQQISNITKGIAEMYGFPLKVIGDVVVSKRRIFSSFL